VVFGWAILFANLGAARVINSQKFPPSSLPSDAYDAVVVGAGPSGATLGYFAAGKGAKVCIVLKAGFGFAPQMKQACGVLLFARFPIHASTQR
jgi:alkyl hydroperoxide reductase subunit AhpF